LPSGACFIVSCPLSFVFPNYILQFCFFVRCFSGLSFCQLSFVYFVNNLVSALFVFCLFVSYLLSLCQISFVSLSVIFCLCVSYLLSLCHLFLSVILGLFFYIIFCLFVSCLLSLYYLPFVSLSAIFCLFVYCLIFLCQFSFVSLSLVSLSLVFCTGFVLVICLLGFLLLFVLCHWSFIHSLYIFFKCLFFTVSRHLYYVLCP